MPNAPTPDALPDTVALETPDYHWEGPFDVTRGEAEDSFIVRAMIGFHGDLIEGSGELHLTNDDGEGPITITGDRTGGDVRFSIWFADGEARSPLDCEGEMSADEQTMKGDWSFECLDPENCGCGGGGGTFTLERVRD
jgi:hypothetical protein